MTPLLIFALLQLAVIAIAGWQATAYVLLLDFVALLIAAAEGVRRLGLAGLLRWLAVRLDCAAWAVDGLGRAFQERRAAWAEREAR